VIAPAHVALIGCGFTGTSAFFQLVDRYPVKEITIFEASGRFGPGYPYQPDECRDYLINNTNDTMCLVPSNRRGFVEWLRAHPEQAPNLDEKGHLPRSVYGAFLEDVFASARTAAAVKGIRVQLIPAEATAIREDAEGRVHIGWKKGETVADMAILATGRCPDFDAYEHPPEGSGARYIANHVMSGDFDDLALDATVHLLGTSLSAYDVVNRLFSPDTGCRFERDSNGELAFVPGPNERRVVMCSRGGRLKNMQSRTPMAILRRHFTEAGLQAAAGEHGLKLVDVADLIRQEAAAHGAAIDWPEVMDPYAGCQSAKDTNRRIGALLEAAIESAKGTGSENFLVEFFTDAQVTVWDSFAKRLLTPDAERAYRAEVETAVLSYVASCPIPTAEKLLALHRSGRLTVLKGVREVALGAAGSHYAITHAFGVARASVLVNTTNSVDRRVMSTRQSALIRNLAESGLLSPYTRDGEEMNGAAVDMATFRAIGARKIFLANMFLWGPGFFTSSAIMMATIVDRLLKAAFSAGGVEAY